MGLRALGPALLAMLMLASSAFAQAVNSGNVEGELHSARAAVAPGERFTIVLRQNIAEGWHTYWRNSGDSGQPTELTWTAPPRWTVGPIQWPAPEPAPFGPIVNYGYHGEVFFPIEIAVPADARIGQRVTLVADAYWLVCSDVCIPEEARLTLTLPVEAVGRDDPIWASRVAGAVAALPRQERGVEARITSGDPARLSITLPGGAGEIRNPHFFTYDREIMAHSEPQRPRVGDAGLSFDIPLAATATALGRAALEGVVTFEQRNGEAWARRAIEIVAQPGDALDGTRDRLAPISDDYPLSYLETANAVADAPRVNTLGLLIALGAAFLAGLILNVMPCVLPVLSVKALAFAHGAAAGESRRQGVFYAVGVMATFLALAGVLIALREAGAAVGWGFQLQSPLVTSGLALLFFVIGLNLAGVFEFGAGAQNFGAGLASRSGDAGAFFTGALAVVAATPCTAPFMAGALGAALTQPAHITLIVFAALALGFALPLTLLHFVPAFQKLIPKPGPWMERVRNLLAFPMFGAAVWLAWVLTAQTGAAGALAVLSLAAALAFVLYVARWGRAWIAAGLLALAATAALTWKPLAGVETETVLAHEPWSPARVAELSGEGRGVFVNFTAAWCVTCKFNEATVFSQPRVARAFAESDTAYLIADWTNRDAEIAAILDEHRWPGVPLYLYYPPGSAQAQVLPLEGFGARAVIAALQGETR